VHTALLDGGSRYVVASGQSNVRAAASDGTTVYWTRGSGGEVWRALVDGGERTAVAMGQSFPTAITIDDSFVYWVNSGFGSPADGTVMKKPLDGGTAFPILQLNGKLSFITVDATDVYVVSDLAFPGGVVLRVSNGR
jgi:hypothetical protein